MSKLAEAMVGGRWNSPAHDPTGRPAAQQTSDQASYQQKARIPASTALCDWGFPQLGLRPCTHPADHALDGWVGQKHCTRNSLHFWSHTSASNSQLMLVPLLTPYITSGDPVPSDTLFPQCVWRPRTEWAHHLYSPAHRWLQGINLP